MKEKIFIFLIIVIVCLFIFSEKIMLWMLTPTTYRNPSDYKKVLTNIENADKVSHFPKIIPNDAENVQIYGYVSAFGRELLILKFKTNKKYIQDVFNNNKFINANTPVGTKQKIYFMPSDNGRISSKDMTFYVIDDESNKPYYEKYFPYFSGIGVDKNYKYILFYYTCPD